MATDHDDRSGRPCQTGVVAFFVGGGENQAAFCAEALVISA